MSSRRDYQLGHGDVNRAFKWEMNDCLPSRDDLVEFFESNAGWFGRDPQNFPANLLLNRTRKDWYWGLRYRRHDSRMPFMPEGIPSTLFSLRRPERVGSIRLESPHGDGLTSGRLWVETRPRPSIDAGDIHDAPSSDDEFIWHDLGVVTGVKTLTWVVPDLGRTRLVSSIRFRADFSDKDRSIELRLGLFEEATP